MTFATLTTQLERLAQQATLVGGPLDAHWRVDLWDWLCAQVQTIDEASQAQRPWPADKAYLHDLCTLLTTEPLLAIPKSRRMMVSWLIAAYCTWKARYQPYQLLLVQSATEEKAAYLVGERCQFIEQHLTDPTYRRAYTPWRTKKGLGRPFRGRSRQGAVY